MPIYLTAALSYPLLNLPGPAPLGHLATPSDLRPIAASALWGFRLFGEPHLAPPSTYGVKFPNRQQG